MNHEQAYQLALKFFRAGKAGAAMPAVDDMTRFAACSLAYEAGKRAA